MHAEAGERPEETTTGDDLDPATLSAARAGDLDAFTALVHHLQPHIHRFLRHLGHDPDVAADLTQDTLVRIHRALPGFEGRSRIKTWALSIARNISNDHLRRSGRRPRVVSDQVDRAPVRTSGPEAAVELRSAVAALPEHLRDVFILVEVEGLRYREAAEVIGIAEGTVKSRMFHARMQLVSWLRSDDAGAGAQ